MTASASGDRKGAGFGRLLTIYGAIALLGMCGEIVYRTLAAGDPAILSNALSFLAGAAAALVILPAAILLLLHRRALDFTIGHVAHHIEMKDE